MKASVASQRTQGTVLSLIRGGVVVRRQVSLFSLPPAALLAHPAEPWALERQGAARRGYKNTAPL